jgi:dTDP-4-amino-4,6-dideoxygalactose transaminase
MTNSHWQSDPAGEITIPVAKPRLPSFDEIAPYLRRIDQSQWYSNGGPLVQELERRLETHIDRETAKVATVANATLGLALALTAYNFPAGSLCMVPAWTFAATAHAIQLAGLQPWIVDVDLLSWALEPRDALAFLKEAPGPVSAILPVSPFGAPITMEGWRDFRERTGIAVVIDAAATFDSIRASDIPGVVSLHATKVLGQGEGGFVVTTDSSYLEEVQKRANFGFWNSREATVRSFNGKMSEYAAAVGLAALDQWGEIRADFARVAGTYAEAFDNRPDISFQRGFGRSWVSSTVVISAPKAGADAIANALSANGIGSRRWWGGGLHRHRAFENCPRLKTTNTDFLVESVIGLPCWRDLSNDDITRVCEVVSAARR